MKQLQKSIFLCSFLTGKSLDIQTRCGGELLSANAAVSSEQITWMSDDDNDDEEEMASG